MMPTPTGQIVRTPDGYDLVIVRTFRASIQDVWASITEPDRTARWFAAWTGEPGAGRTIHYTMTFEAEGPAAEMQIEACDPPRHLAVRALNDYGAWRLEAHLSESGGITELRFTQHLDTRANVGDLGPGWEYYLDNLAASRTGDPLPNWNDYYPAQKAYYLDLAKAE